jgi:hypothetical protein
MPSHTIHSALTKMHYDLPGAPWIFPAWKDLTGVRNGLFPTEDHLLPLGWSPATAEQISSYFDQFRACKKEDDKIKFSSAKKGGDVIPGRKLWRDWVSDGWKKWKIHAKITDVLVAENLHPFMIAAQSNSWPDGAEWTPLAVDPVGTALFGEDSCNDGLGRLKSELRSTTKALIQRTWMILYNQHTRSKVRIAHLESEAIKAFEGWLLHHFPL